LQRDDILLLPGGVIDYAISFLIVLDASSKVPLQAFLPSLGPQADPTLYVGRSLQVRLATSSLPSPRRGRLHTAQTSLFVAAEFALIRAVDVGAEQYGGAQAADKFLVVIAKHGQELFDRPVHVTWTQFNIVAGAQLAVFSLGERDGLSCWYPLGCALRITAQAGQRISGSTLM
jgi:hypothetical protein